MISAYSPDFWMNQPKLEYKNVTDAGVEHSFKSTNEVWIVTRCRGGPCVDPADFKITYIKKENVAEVEDIPSWSLIITIYIGFSFMAIAFLYFEWRCVLHCL